MKERIAGFLAGLLLAFISAATIVLPASAGQTINCWDRVAAASYGYTARYEGYEWGGGWWTDNNQDDTPGCPTDGGSSCEGPDCSGLAFKTWAMQNSSGATGYTYWLTGENVHGPYASTSFRDGCSGACFDVCGSGTGSACGTGSYSSTVYMDVFAKSGHDGLIYQEGSNGYDSILEALNNTSGVGIWQRSYRTDPAYDGVRRQNWSVGC